MRDTNHFDYIIIGNGLAGLQLAMELSKDSFFKNYKIALIDPSEKTENDKTWSFWEEGLGKYDAVVEKIWQTATFESSDISLNLPLQPYQYKTIRSLDFYTWAKNDLANKENFKFILDRVKSIEEAPVSKVIGDHATYTANHIFDSRIPKDFHTEHSKYTLIHQHFKGWIIETDSPCFLPEVGS